MRKITELWGHRIPGKTVKLLDMLANFQNNCTPQTVSTAINELIPGDTFAICVRSQNFGLMIHVPQTEELNDGIQNVIVAEFPGNLNSKKIYNHSSGIEVRLYFLIKSLTKLN